MADQPSSPVTLDPTPPDPPPQNPNPIPPPIPSFSPAGVAPPPLAPSFRPAVPYPAPAQFSPVPNSNFQSPNVSIQPPGVNPSMPMMIPNMANGSGSVTIPVSPMMPSGMYQVPPGQVSNPLMRPYAPMPMPMPNGFPPNYAYAPQGTIPPGVPRYAPPYTTMVRPAFPPRPPGPIGMLPPLTRPPIPGMRGPMISPLVRPGGFPIFIPAEKPQTTVYVGKIAPTVENDFMLSLLQLCGPVKSWKRVQGPSDGALRSFGFCEFESAEGVLRALRLLAKFNVDRQELVLNVNQATREYLERYVAKKTEEQKKSKETAEQKKEEETAPGVEKHEPPKPSVEEAKKDANFNPSEEEAKKDANPSEEDAKKDANDSGDKENQDVSNFGIVSEEDREADMEALEKLTSLIEERLKTKPLPPPPPPPPPHAPLAVDAPRNSNSEHSKPKGGDPDVDIARNDAVEDKNEDENASESKPTSEQDRPATSSPDRSSRYDRRDRGRDRERDRERDMKRDKERELERYERERERERVRRERDRELKIRETERLYKERVKEWESREREREYQRQHEKEREKERERERRREIMDQEDASDDEDDDGRKRRRRSNLLEERRKKRLREKEEDKLDRLSEEEEIEEAKKKAAIEEQQLQQQKDELKLLSDHIVHGSEKAMSPEDIEVERKEEVVDQASEGDSDHANHIGDGVLQNGIGDESAGAETTLSEMSEANNAPAAKKLGFGLQGSGKRTAVLSVFHEEEDDDAHKDKKMRPLVPIDYSTEEIQAVQSTAPGAPPNLAAAAEFAKRISNVNPKEERAETERERSRRSHDRSSQRDRDRNDEESNRFRDEKSRDRDRDREHGSDKQKTPPDNKKLLDAKQLIDMIPKTKEELFSYEINWAVYDKHELHDRMRPWISKKITEFLGEEEATLVDYIVHSTQQHTKAAQVLEMLQSILDDEAEMFVLKMWRMLIFEIKKVETGLSFRSKS